LAVVGQPIAEQQQPETGDGPRDEAADGERHHRRIERFRLRPALWWRHRPRVRRKDRVLPVVRRFQFRS
jgi:hypothetical protein